MNDQPFTCENNRKKTLDSPTQLSLPRAGVTRLGETRLPSPQRTLLLLFRSYGLIRQSQRPLLDFGFWPRWRSLGRWSPVPAARRTFPTLSLRIFPRMPDPVPRRSHSVHIPVSSTVSSAFPSPSQGRLPANCPLETTSCGPQISERQIFLDVQGRGRNSGYPLPPAQSRAGTASAHGSYLGCLASKRT